MSKRNYNVFFNTHTVSGIVISVALYIIFFAGAFSLFKHEIEAWEEGTHSKNVAREQIDYDFLIKKITQEKSLISKDVKFYLGGSSDDIYILTSAAQDTINTPKKDRKQDYFSVNIHTGEKSPYEEKYSLGEFLYRLHFFAQIPGIGAYLAGFVALFFLFAIVTGVIVHWKKIIPNFYQFNPKTTLKRIWTDAHTALGVIGLPFQFIFAITGTYFCLSLFALIPANILYNGNQQKLLEDLRPDRKIIQWEAKTEKTLPSINHFVKQNVTKFEHFEPLYVIIKNFGGTNMQYLLFGDLNYKERFISSGIITYDFSTNTTKITQEPNKTYYADAIQKSMGRLHFGDFGGVAIKIIYFILALITCFVIITGVLIWIEARNKKSMSLKQRLYTAKVGHIYLAICLSLYPVIALFFLVIKLLPYQYQTQKMTILYSSFFTVWLLATIFLRYKRDNYFTNKVTLLFGAIFGFLIPLASGFVSNNWIWNTYKAKQFNILTVDLLWIVLSIIALLIYFKIQPKVKEKSTFNKYPLDYKNRKELLAKENITALKNIQTSQKTTLNQNIPMRTKIVILWIFLGIGWIVHHLYGLFNIYYNETLIMDNATGEAPVIHHIYRILFEGMCLLFGLLTLEVSKKWFKISAIIWASIAGLYNVYHVIEALLYESSNISEIFMLILVALASGILIKNLYYWIKN
ncbi:MAG: PepSY-associated TM helix domain-containing protein [Tenacibaculum sp.]